MRTSRIVAVFVAGVVVAIAPVRVASIRAAGQGVSDPAPLATTIRQVTLTTRDLAYDPVRKVIYASVPSTAGSIGNTVTVIDPVTATIGQSVFVGSEPTRLAVSDNSQALYVSLDGAAAVRRLDLATLTPGMQFGLGSDSSGPYIVSDMFVMGGTTDSLVVLRRTIGGGSSKGVAVYDNGVPRPTTTVALTDFIEPSTNPAALYGFICCNDIQKMTVSALGVTITQTLNDLFSNSSDFRSENNLLYQQSGRKVDPEAGVIAGTYSVGSFSNAVLPEARANRVYFITSNGVAVFEQDTFRSLGTISMSLGGTPSALIRWGLNGLAFRTSNNQIFLIESPLIGTPTPAGDFEADLRTDIAVWRPSDSNWYVRYSSLGAVNSFQFGLAGDVIVPGDYDADGKADIGVWRPSSGTWYTVESATGTMRVRQLGVSSDQPMARDYDGDGKADSAVYRAAEGLWYIFQSATSTLRVLMFGFPTDRPVPADFDGDRLADIAVYRPASGIWYILRSSDNNLITIQFGASEDRPVPRDYDGDGKADIAVFRPSTGIWYSLRSSDGGFRATQFGISTDVTVPGDYDGDGKDDIAVFRDGMWYVLQSSNSVFFSVPFGQAGDVPVPFGYVR